MNKQKADKNATLSCLFSTEFYPDEKSYNDQKAANINSVLLLTALQTDTDPALGTDSHYYCYLKTKHFLSPVEVLSDPQDDALHLGFMQ